MGMSGMKGQVYYVDSECPTTDCDTGWVHPSIAAAACLEDEVTKFTVVDSVNKREYGHDKSYGWQDICAGTRRFGITLDAVWRPKPEGSGIDELLYAGRVLYLILYPLGSACDVVDPMKGYAMIDQVTKTYDQERGEPVSYTCSLSSKGPWIGLGVENYPWGGFECYCDSGSE